MDKLTAAIREMKVPVELMRLKLASKKELSTTGHETTRSDEVEQGQVNSRR